MEFKYWFEMPNRWTFKMKKLRKFLTKFIYELPRNSKILIPFAGQYRFDEFIFENYNFIYNDLNPDIKADHNIEAYKLKDIFSEHYFDMIIADPPYTHYQGNVKYEGFQLQEITRWRKTANYLLRPGGIYIELGYNSQGLHHYKAKKIAIGLCSLGASHNDIIIAVQQKPEDNVEALF